MSNAGSFERSLQPIILTVAAVLIGIGLAVMVNMTAALIHFVMVLVPIFFLWMTRDVPSLEERIAQLDAERAQKRAAAPPDADRLAA